ncbi:hypothetical protein GUITHDRAFT_116911 [Guillardia theta CCMP2712]|uniref:Uncharacterized protein n=1 Tax=Guillardia theta (strain CCMP2712) TaxID=905079 RepID=L1IKW1_GUITC|nr:hypothetical protein GUITHDRAFT_116911 [Guillardia theta CCMP2712]EKX36888.1 hypothetical protein GUITHDRAFT_116911 [Guillardia theta CCMP2712]|eukprot:XP_005823868.1 hypothetical protein GUITHDRAFT_116911 [Guillardia theta CCMP2712]
MVEQRLEQTDKKNNSTRSWMLDQRREHRKEGAGAGAGRASSRPLAILQHNFTGKEEIIRFQAQAWEEARLLKEAYWLIGGDSRPLSRRREVLAMQVKHEAQLNRYMGSMMELLQEKPLAQLEGSSESFRSQWRRGPGALLGLLLRTSMMISSFVFVSCLLLLQLGVVGVRTCLWILLWGMDYGNRREWWIPELVESVMWLRHELMSGSLSKQLQGVYEEGRRMAQTTVLFLLSLFSPEIQSKFIQYASSAKTRGQDYFRQLRSKILEVRDLVEEERGGAGQGRVSEGEGAGQGRGGSGSKASGQVDFASKLEDARRASEARMTRRLGFEPLKEAFNVTSSWTEAGDDNLTRAEDPGQLERPSKRSMTMRLLKNMSAAVTSSVSAGVSMTLNFSPPDVGNVSGEVLGVASSWLATAGNIANDLGVGHWQGNLTSWLGGGGKEEENKSSWQQMLSGVTEGTSRALSSLQLSIGSLDQSLMTAVDATELAVSKALTQTTVALPWLQSAEDWVRGNEFAMRKYLQVQQRWHALLLWGQPIWEKVDMWAKEVKIPELAQRILLNAIYYRLQYFGVRNMLVLVVAHGVIHARQERRPPAPRKAIGGLKGMAVKIQVSILDVFRAVPLAGRLEPPGEPTSPAAAADPQASSSVKTTE